MNDGWQMKTIADVCSIRPPKSEARSALSPKDFVSFVPMEDLPIGSKTLLLNQERRLSDVVGSYTYFADGDILLAKITPCFENGKLGIASNLKNSIGFGSSEYIVLRTHPEINSEWLYYYLDREAFRKEGASRMSGAVGHKRVPQEFIEQYPIPVPPLKEQGRIVAKLDQALEAIESATANIEEKQLKTEELFASYLSARFSTRHSGSVVKRLGDTVTRLTNGYVGPTRNIYHDTGVPYLLAKHVKNNVLAFDGKTYVTETFNQKSRKSILRTGDVLLVQSGHIGHSAVVPAEHDGHNCHAMIVITPAGDKLCGTYLSWYFASPSTQREFKRIRTGSTVPHLNCGDVIEMLVPVPPISQQRIIAEEIEEFRANTLRLTELGKRKTSALKNLRESVLNAAFTGQL